MIYEILAILDHLHTFCREKRKLKNVKIPLSPSEEFELTGNALGAHIETDGGLILGTLS